VISSKNRFRSSSLFTFPSGPSSASINQALPSSSYECHHEKVERRERREERREKKEEGKKEERKKKERREMKEER